MRMKKQPRRGEEEGEEGEIIAEEGKKTKKQLKREKGK
jgi:hypothetical protein